MVQMPLLVHAQEKFPLGYCSNVQGAPIESYQGKIYSDSLFLAYESDKDGITVNIVNKTEDTKYLFSSYFDNMYFGSEFIHRIDEVTKSYTVSLAPLTPYLVTKTGDRIITGKRKITLKDQIPYNFIQLKADTYYSLRFKYEDLFSNLKVTKELDINKLNKYDEIKFKAIELSRLQSKYSFFLEFAFYESVDLLCEESAYFLKEVQFNDQAKSFSTIKLKVRAENTPRDYLFW